MIPAPAPPTGRLVLVPNALDLGHADATAAPLDAVLPAGTIDRAAALTHWLAEDARSARALLKRVHALRPLALPLQQIVVGVLPRPRKGSNEAVPAAAWEALLAPARAGHDLGLVSEAGLPAVADPGAELVAAAHAAGLVVRPLVGPSSLMMALSASGLNGQSFAFVGYLPQEPDARLRRLRELEALSRTSGQAQLFIETPYRNQALTQALMTGLQPTTRLSISCGLTLEGGWTCSQTVGLWRRSPAQVSDRMPAVFAIQAG